MDESVHPLTLELLQWISSHSATYPELMEVWRSNCPRHSTWEDAVIAGLVELTGEFVSLTAKGHRVLHPDQ